MVPAPISPSLVLCCPTIIVTQKPTSVVIHLMLKKGYDSRTIDTLISDIDLIPGHLTSKNNSPASLTLPD